MWKDGMLLKLLHCSGLLLPDACGLPLLPDARRRLLEERRAAPEGDGNRQATSSTTLPSGEDHRGGHRLSIREGESISVPLKRSKRVPADRRSHDRGRREVRSARGRCSRTSSRAYDAQVDTRVQALTSLLEPLMIVIMGGAVGFIAFAILMPLIQMNDFIQ